MSITVCNGKQNGLKGRYFKVLSEVVIQKEPLSFII